MLISFLGFGFDPGLPRKRGGGGGVVAWWLVKQMERLIRTGWLGSMAWGPWCSRMAYALLLHSRGCHAS